ncbi:hypothetical protein GGQ84_001301 [Desulfitispora alkaliphila]|uniref:sigma factor G inhibitor Gin n=1 Tax=Desulfitispora alkaliphila TaxID=622674 RepID=UPI003D19C9C2
MNLVPKCIICEQVPEKGIVEGVFLNRKFICDSCEEHIANVMPGDQHYDEIVEKIRLIWNHNNSLTNTFVNKNYKQ